MRERRSWSARSCVVAALIALASKGAFAGADVQIDPDPTGVIQNETSITLVPGSAGRVVVAYNSDPFASTGLGVTYSTDGGATWPAGNVTNLPQPNVSQPMAVSFDPTIAADRSGNVYVGTISFGSTVSFLAGSGLYVYKSTTGGASWGSPVEVSYNAGTAISPDPSFELNDKCHMTVGPKPGNPAQDNIYVTWIKDQGYNVGPYSAIYFSGSTDSGATFSAPTYVSDIPAGAPPVPVPTSGHFERANGPNVAVAPNGTVYVAWLDVDVTNPQGSISTLYIDSSTDGGVTWGTDQQVQQINSCPGHLSQADGTADARARSYPSIAVDPASSSTVYMVYAEDVTTGDTDEGDIFFTKSTTGGTAGSWSTPFKLNWDDTTLNDNFEPWMAVKPDGTIDVVWYDRRNDLGTVGDPTDPGDRLWDVYMVSSIDGGATWSNGIRITDTSFATPVIPGGERWMGEYLGIDVDSTDAYIAFTSSITDGLGDVYFDRTPNPFSVTGVVPEPSCLGLGLFGLAALGLKGGRKRD